MSTYDLASYHTILDVAKLHNNKELLDAAQVLHKKNGLMRVASWLEANQLTSHVYSKEMSLPSGTWRSENEGIAPTNAQFQQGVEPLSRIESRSEIDEYIIDDIVPNPNEYRYTYDMQHVEGLGQAIVDAFLYGDNIGDINKPKGIQPRYNSLALANVHDNGCDDASAVTSIYVVQFGPGKANLLYGRDSGSKVIKREDKGKQFVVTDTTTGAGLYKYITNFHSVMGLCVEDDRAVQRIADIGTDGADELQLDLLIWALDSLPDPDDAAGTVIFCNRLTRYQIAKAVRDRPNMIFTSVDEYGQRVDSFLGAKIVLLEGIKNTETVI